MLVYQRVVGVVKCRTYWCWRLHGVFSTSWGVQLVPNRAESRIHRFGTSAVHSICMEWHQNFFSSSELYCLQGNGNRTPDSFHVTRPYNLPKPIPQGLVTPCGPLPAPLQVGLPPAVLAMPLGTIDGDELRLYLADLAPTKVGRNWGDVIGIEYDRTI